MSKEVICPLAQQGKCPEPDTKCQHRDKHEHKMCCALSSNGHYSCGAGPCVEYVETTPNCKKCARVSNTYDCPYRHDGKCSLEGPVSEPPKEQGEFKRETKYLVIKKADADKYLNSTEQANLQGIFDVIAAKRVEDGKTPFNNYIVVNQDEPYAEIVWKLIEEGKRKQYPVKVGPDFGVNTLQDGVQSERQRIIGLVEQGITELKECLSRQDGGHGSEQYCLIVETRISELNNLLSEISSGQPVPDPADAMVDKVLEIVKRARQEYDAGIRYKAEAWACYLLEKRIAALKSSKEGGK